MSTADLYIQNARALPHDRSIDYMDVDTALHHRLSHQLMLCQRTPMTTRQRLNVSVNSDLTLDAGWWEEIRRDAGGVRRLVHPSTKTMFRQVVDYLSSLDAPLDGWEPTLEEEALAATAVCVRWGTYLAVLADGSQDLTRQTRQKHTSRVADSEMARINVEASAALERWIDLLRHERERYFKLVRATRCLPMTRRRAPRTADGQQLLLVAQPDLAAAVRPMLETERGKQALADAERHPTRVLANALVHVAWRNGPVEDIHAGAAGAYPLTMRRILPSEERTLVSSTSGRLRHGLRAVHALICEQSERSWPRRVLPCAVAPFLAPRAWSLEGQSRRVDLPGGE